MKYFDLITLEVHEKSIICRNLTGYIVYELMRSGMVSNSSKGSVWLVIQSIRCSLLSFNFSITDNVFHCFDNVFHCSEGFRCLEGGS